MEMDFKNEEFKELLKIKEKQIYQRTDDAYSESRMFRKLLLNLTSYNNSSPFKDYLAIVITKDDIDNLIDDISETLQKTLSTHEALSHNYLLLDNSLAIKAKERKSFPNNTNARKFYSELSKDFCVFLLTPKGLHYFVDGIDDGNVIFFTSDELNSYTELKDIGQLLEVCEQYQNELELRDTYRKFFVTKSAKSSLYKHLKINGHIQEDYPLDDFLVQNSQLLNNKPEDIFREDLRFYLKNKLKAKVLAKELVLENFKRLDIYIYDEFGELYFIEVKWMGVSIHPSGERLGTAYYEKDINPDAIFQTLDYLKELAKREVAVKIGYLAVFDGRGDTSLEDSVKDFDKSLLDENLKPYYRRFIKIPDFVVINSHP